MRKVTIIQETIPHYRVSLFDAMHSRLLKASVDLEVVYSRGRNLIDTGPNLEQRRWATEVPLRRFRTRSSQRGVVWQSAVRQARHSDLIILEHANRMLINYAILLVFRPRFTKVKVAFWGHGANLQTSKAHGLKERLKATTARLPDWWFAYTEGSAARVRETGFPARRITVLNNSIATGDYPADPTKLALHCVFVGTLHDYKRIDLLLEAAEIVAGHLPGFHLDMIGDGPQRDDVEEFSAGRQWITFHGAKVGVEKQFLLARAQLMLMPGLVGLAVIDAFAAQTPILTCADSLHSPEIEYLDSGQNGMIVEGEINAERYAAWIEAILTDQPLLDRLRRGCQTSRDLYALEGMVDAYVQGVIEALRQAPFPKCVIERSGTRD